MRTLRSHWFERILVTALLLNSCTDDGRSSDDPDEHPGDGGFSPEGHGGEGGSFRGLGGFLGDGGGAVVTERICPNGDCEQGETCSSCPLDCICESPCPSLEFPSGLHLQTYEDAAMSATYDTIADDACYPRPECWIDVDHLLDPTTGIVHDISVSVSDHFQLSEFVETELPYSHKVLLDPALVSELEAFRSAHGGVPVKLTSGYRSPDHQRAVCQDVCGQDCCPDDPLNPCACRSRHEWGDAADIASATPASLYADAGDADFGYCLAESGHLHVDMNPCGAGCPP